MLHANIHLERIRVLGHRWLPKQERTALHQAMYPDWYKYLAVILPGLEIVARIQAGEEPRRQLQSVPAPLRVVLQSVLWRIPARHKRSVEEMRRQPPTLSDDEREPRCISQSDPLRTRPRIP